MDAETRILELSKAAPAQPTAEWLADTRAQAAKLFPAPDYTPPVGMPASLHAQHRAAISEALRAAQIAVIEASHFAQHGATPTQAETVATFKQWRAQNPTAYELRTRWLEEQKRHAWPIHWAKERYAALHEQGF